MTTEAKDDVPERLYVMIYPSNPIDRFAAYEIDPRDVHDNGKPVYIYARVDPAREVQVKELVKRLESPGFLCRDNCVTCDPIRAALEAVKGKK